MFMQTHEIIININDISTTYTFNLHYKRMKNIVFRAEEDTKNSFKVSLPYGTRLSELEKVFMRNLPSLERLQSKKRVIPFQEFTYIYGQKILIKDIATLYSLRKNPIDLTSFYKLIKPVVLKYLIEKVAFYSDVMNIPVTYKIRIRTMKTRWGTNSKKTMTLTFNERIIHFHPRIIDALIVHELGHYFISGHGPKFYNYLEKVFPEYRKYDKMLMGYNYEGNI